MQRNLETVRKKIRQLFPKRPEEEILAILEAYGLESHETGTHRVHLAILKLCEEEQLSDPAHYVKIAKQDFRDVLAWAEYPNQMKFGPSKDPEKSAELKRKDEKQYQEWLSKIHCAPE